MNEFKPFSQREILFINERHKASVEGLQLVTESNFSRARSRGYIFLSHSNKDEQLALAFVRYMAQHRVQTYVDLYDSSLPIPPSAATAQKLKARIINAQEVILLATQNSVRGSSWCPWEIGFADGISKSIGIAVTEDGVDEYGAEYLELYPAMILWKAQLSSMPQMAFATCRRGMSGLCVQRFERWV